MLDVIVTRFIVSRLPDMRLYISIWYTVGMHYN